MGRRRGLPGRAERVESVTGIIRTGPREGQEFTIARYRVPDCYADGGAEFVTVDGGDMHRCFRYSGRKVGGAADQVRQFRDHLAGRA